MFYILLVFSAVLLVGTNLLARLKSGGIASACVAAGIGLVLGVACLLSPAMMLNAFLVLLAGLICLAARARAATFLKSSLAATVLAYVIVITYTTRNVQESEELKTEYPLESMAERLAYELPARNAPAAEAPRSTIPTAAPTPGASQIERMAALEQKVEREQGWMRTDLLKRVHQSHVQQFIDSPGFGVGRRMTPSKTWIDFESKQRNDEEPVRLPPPEYQDPMKPVTERGQPEPAPGSPRPDLLLGLHDEGLVDFVNPKGFGYIQDREHVAGFRAHGFSKMPESKESQRWSIQRLELVSLLKHEQPVAYISDYLPRMDKLRNAPTRPLDEFETKALDQLERGKDLEVEYTPDRIRMLGSVRALAQCVKCHHAERGELLGAFTYKLKREAGKP